MKINKSLIILILIVIIASFFRLYNLGSVPPSPTIDEASLGYNAYSILKTGADEYGSKFPILLRAYDDWRPALYVYPVVLLVALLDLTAMAVRLPSAILGVITVIGVYFLSKELFRGIKLKFEIGGFSIGIPEVSALLLALSPWHVYISRLGHEVNLFITFLILGVLFFLRFVSGKPWNLILSSVFFGLAFNSYQSGKIVIPAIVLILAALFIKKLLNQKKYLIISVLIGFLVILPILSQSFGGNSLIRYKATSIFENSPVYFQDVSRRYSRDLETGDLLGRLIDNKKTATILLVSKAYLSHLDPVWLFYNEGEEPFKAPGIGLLYLLELPLIFLGLLFVLRSGIDKKYLSLILLWGAVAILPGSITTGFPHAMRSFALLPIPQVFAALGFLTVLSFFKDKKAKYAVVTIFGILLILSTLWFYHSYFVLLPREISHHFQFGAWAGVSEIIKVEEQYDNVYISNKEKLFESYMYYLFLSGKNPSEYQKNGGTVSGGFDEEHKIGKYFFGDVSGKNDPGLYLINPEEKTESMVSIGEVLYPSGETALLITEIK